VVRLIGAYPNVILRIEDDGKGFDVAARERAGFSEKRMGISSMRERVNLMMGQMTIQSRPGAGTRIVIRFPFRAAPDDRVP
jgi:signal transduction histidine kinase